MPEEFIPDVLQVYHEEGHWAYRTVFSRIRNHFYWRKMYDDTVTFCKTCDVCQKCNKGKKFVGRMSYLEVKERNELIGIDTYSGLPTSPYGNNKILVVTDYLTRFCWLISVPDTTAPVVARALVNTWCSVFGPPKMIIADRGRDNREFGNQLMQALYNLMGSEKLSTVGYRPQAIGTTERFNRTMTAWLTKKLEGIHTRWEDVLPALMWEYNSTVHWGSGLCLGGRRLSLPI